MELKFIGDRCGILGTIILHEENCGQKNDKNGPKIDKNCAKIALFCTFSVFVLLKFSSRQKTVRMTRQSL